MNASRRIKLDELGEDVRNVGNYRASFCLSITPALAQNNGIDYCQQTYDFTWTLQGRIPVSRVFTEAHRLLFMLAAASSFPLVCSRFLSALPLQP